MITKFCHLCKQPMTEDDDPYSCICRKCENIELVDKLTEFPAVESEENMTD